MITKVSTPTHDIKQYAKPNFELDLPYIRVDGEPDVGTLILTVIENLLVKNIDGSSFIGNSKPVGPVYVNNDFYIDKNTLTRLSDSEVDINNPDHVRAYSYLIGTKVKQLIPGWEALRTQIEAVSLELVAAFDMMGEFPVYALVKNQVESFLLANSSWTGVSGTLDPLA